MLRIRLRRTGAKKQPKYRVVVADVRAPRDGAFVDSIGYYDPLTEPSTISIDRERALDWMSKGAQPSDTVQRLMRIAGIVEGPEPVYPERKKAAPAAEAAPARAPSAPAPAPAAAPAAAAAAAETEPEAEAAAAPEASAATEEPSATEEATGTGDDGTEPAKQ